MSSATRGAADLDAADFEAHALANLAIPLSPDATDEQLATRMKCHFIAQAGTMDGWQVACIKTAREFAAACASRLASSPLAWEEQHDQKGPHGNHVVRREHGRDGSLVCVRESWYDAVIEQLRVVKASE